MFQIPPQSTTTSIGYSNQYYSSQAHTIDLYSSMIRLSIGFYSNLHASSSHFLIFEGEKKDKKLKSLLGYWAEGFSTKTSILLPFADCS